MNQINFLLLFVIFSLQCVIKFTTTTYKKGRVFVFLVSYDYVGLCISSKIDKVGKNICGEKLQYVGLKFWRTKFRHQNFWQERGRYRIWNFLWANKMFKWLFLCSILQVHISKFVLQIWCWNFLEREEKPPPIHRITWRHGAHHQTWDFNESSLSSNKKFKNLFCLS